MKLKQAARWLGTVSQAAKHHPTHSLARAGAGARPEANSTPLDGRGLKSAAHLYISLPRARLCLVPTAHAAGGEGVVLVAAALGLGISRVGQSSRSWNEYRDFLEWCN